MYLTVTDPFSKVTARSNTNTPRQIQCLECQCTAGIQRPLSIVQCYAWRSRPQPKRRSSPEEKKHGVRLFPVAPRAGGNPEVRTEDYGTCQQVLLLRETLPWLTSCARFNHRRLSDARPASTSQPVGSLAGARPPGSELDLRGPTKEPANQY